MNETPNILPTGSDELEARPTEQPVMDIQNRVQALIESPLVPKIQGWMNRCADPKLKVPELAALADEGTGLLAEIETDPNMEVLRDVVRLTRVFLISRQGSTVIVQTQGEWRSSLSELGEKGGWHTSLAAWNSGKLDSQMAGILDDPAQIAFLRQSLESFLRAARQGVQQLPMTMPVVGAEVDASYLQTPEQRGTPMVDKLPPPYRLIAALAVTVAYIEKQAGNQQRVDELLAIADEHRAIGLEAFKDMPFPRLNLIINKLIADGTVRSAGNTAEIETYIAELSDASGVTDFKKLEWSAHAHALRALSTGDIAHIEDCFVQLEAIAKVRPQFMEIIAIEPTFKELVKRFPDKKGRLMDIIATQYRSA
jgi:hypothetical protein